MHFYQSSLLVRFLRESDEPISSGDAGDGIEHDLCTLAAVEGANEFGSPVIPQTQDRISKHCHQVRIGRFRREVSDKDTVFFLILLILILGLTRGSSR